MHHLCSVAARLIFPPEIQSPLLIFGAMMGKVLDRWYGTTLRTKLARPYVQLIFGARQTGKSTVLRALLPAPSLVMDLSDPRERTALSSAPGAFTDVCLALPRRRTPHVVLVDEAQTVPDVFDAVQYLYDLDRTRWRFVLCGSSARRLCATGVNLLPGRAGGLRRRASRRGDPP